MREETIQPCDGERESLLSQHNEKREENYTREESGSVHGKSGIVKGGERDAGERNVWNGRNCKTFKKFGRVALSAELQPTLLLWVFKALLFSLHEEIAGGARKKQKGAVMQ